MASRPCIFVPKINALTTHFQIGIPSHTWTSFLKEEISRIFHPREWTFSFQEMPDDQLYPALLSGQIDLVGQALHLSPVNLPEGIANAALISRMEPVSQLLIQPGARAAKPFQLKEGARVVTAHPWLKAQLQDFRPDLEWVSEHPDGLALSPPEVDKALQEFPEAVSLPLNPRECCPPPGMGAVVLQCCEADKPLRKQLLAVHRQDLSELTNVERRLLQLLGEEAAATLGAFCERDPMNHLHLWVACGTPPVRIRQSSSTTAGLAEQTLALIQ